MTPFPLPSHRDSKTSLFWVLLGLSCHTGTPGHNSLSITSNAVSHCMRCQCLLFVSNSSIAPQRNAPWLLCCWWKSFCRALCRHEGCGDHQKTADVSPRAPARAEFPVSPSNPARVCKMPGGPEITLGNAQLGGGHCVLKATLVV